MKIKSMTACFGKLDHARLELKDGLNILHAPNEGGKSTWCAFIRAMLYGIPTRDRDKKGYLADKNRYQPWSGAPMEGEMLLEWQGRDILLRRFTKGAAPFGGFSALYADTQQPVPDLTAHNCGEVLLGVGREVWERSAFIGASPTLAIEGTAELERRIAALFSSGQEDVSYSQTQSLLREWQRRRRHNRSGLIPQMEEELAGLDAALAGLADTHERFSRAQADISRLEQVQQQLKGEQQIHQRMAARQLNQRYAAALQEREQLADAIAKTQRQGAAVPPDEELLQARQRLGRLDVFREETLRQSALRAAATASLEQARRDCPDHPLLGLTRAQLDELCRQVQQARKRAARLTALSALGPVAAFCVGALLLLEACTPPVILTGMAAACTGVMVPLILSGRKCGRKARELLAQYGATSVEGLPVLWQEQQTLRARLEQAELRMAHSRQEHEQALDRQLTQERELAAFVNAVHSIFSPGAEEVEQAQWAAIIDDALGFRKKLDHLRGLLEQVERRCSDLKAQGAREEDTLEMLHSPEHSPEQTAQLLAQTERELSGARSALDLARGELLTLGDRADPEARREQLLAQLERRRKEYEALSVALDALEQANTALQSRFAPELNHRSGQILSALTNGRYTDLILDRDFDASARSADSLLPRSTLALSRGTADQVYLAVRLAVCGLCLSEEDPSPLVLDDALLTFDDERMALAVDYLSKSGQQVLLFSCQQRESRLGLGNILPLQS